MTKFTNYDINFIKNNYSQYGSIYCGAKLNRPPHLIRIKAYRMGIKINQNRQIQCIKDAIITKQKNKKPEDYKVNPIYFINKINKETAYILGFLWADGYIEIKHNIIKLNIKSKDANKILNIFYKTGKWNVRTEYRMNRGPNKIIKTYNKPLTEFLVAHNYGPNNCKNATIVDIIPKELAHYWFRGAIDGDGCFFINIKRRQKIFSMSGPYDQDWTFFTKLLNNLNIKYTKLKIKSKNGNKCSRINITNYDGIIKIGDYIYKNYDKNKIGLNRKYNKFMLIKNKLIPKMESLPHNSATNGDEK